MKKIKRAFNLLAVLSGMALILCGCTGSGAGAYVSTAASNTSSAASSSSESTTANAGLITDQQIFENFYLSPNASYAMAWSQPSAGDPSSGSGVYLAWSRTTLTNSPLTFGPQHVQSGPYVNGADTLSLPSTIPTTPNRYLVNGSIILEPSPSDLIYSYPGTGVRVDHLASDHTTIIYSYLLSDFSTAPLVGSIGTAPDEFRNWFNTFYYNTALLDASVAWAPGSSYTKFQQTTINDMFLVVDASGTTTDTNVTPLAVGTTLDALLSAGITSSSDGVTYTTDNGTISVLDGVRMYVANVQVHGLINGAYRIYFERNGNVYAGVFVRAGTVLAGNTYRYPIPPSGYQTLTTFYQIRLNEAAKDSFISAYLF